RNTQRGRELERAALTARGSRGRAAYGGGGSGAAAHHAAAARRGDRKVARGGDRARLRLARGSVVRGVPARGTPRASEPAGARVAGAAPDARGGLRGLPRAAGAVAGALGDRAAL